MGTTKSESESCLVVSDSLRPHGLSMEFSRPEYWSGQFFPSPGEFPNPGIEPRSPTLQAESLSTELSGKPWVLPNCCPNGYTYLHSTNSSEVYVFFVCLFVLTSLPILDIINILYLYHEREYNICIFSLMYGKFVFLTKISAIFLYSCFYWIFTFIFLICRSALFLIAIDLLFHKLQNFYTCMIFKFFCTFYYCA